MKDRMCYGNISRVALFLHGREREGDRMGKRFLPNGIISNQILGDNRIAGRPQGSKRRPFISILHNPFQISSSLEPPAKGVGEKSNKVGIAENSIHS